MSDSEIILVEELVREICPLLAGRPPEIQGAVLADLLAMWLAGHTVLTNTIKTDRLREEVLGAHIDAVRELVPANAKAIGLKH